ncbi:hypothetical protein I317_05721 [Kwoniella heveanensis CBS 569]|nr:hypothetical protein I317_05721 [Kwoniella heveanensis CBS 569]
MNGFSLPSVPSGSGWRGDRNREREYVPMTTRDGRSPSIYKSLALRYLPSALILAVGILIGANHPLYLSVYSRRSITPTSLLPPKLPPAPPPILSTSLQAALPAPEEPIPNIVHYVYGLASDPQPDFPYFAYLAMRSALVSLRPEEVWFHCIHEPRGYWWDRVRDWEGWTDEHGLRKGMVRVLKARDVQWIGKDRKPVVHFAHKADIIRLEVLRDYGGIYLDIDTFVLDSFESHSLLRQDVVLGMEAHGLTFLRGTGGDDEMQPKGLCNAVIIARQNAEFLNRWLASYDGFREDKWTEHSVEMPWTLAQMYPTLLTVLSERAFFWPLWTDDHIYAVYETTEYDFEKSGQLAYHAWESKARPYLSALDPSTVQTIDTSFTRMARKFVGPDEERRWRTAVASKVEGSTNDQTGLGVGDEESQWEETAGAGAGANAAGGVLESGRRRITYWGRERT